MSELRLNTDGHIIKFGADNDVSLTHVADAGLLLNSTMKLQFNDASQFVQGTSATVLSIGATDEIDLTATAVDLNGTLNVSGVATFQATPVFPDGSLALADLDIDGGTDIGAAIVDADLFIIDDGAGGTNRKTTAARLKTYIGSFDTDAAQVFNESSADVDFRVESNGNDHMLFVDGGNDHVMIGTSSDLGGVFGVNGDQENQGNFKIKHTGDAPRILRLDANRGAGGDSLGDIEFMWDGNIDAKMSGVAKSDTTNKDDAGLFFFTRTSGASLAQGVGFNMNQTASFSNNDSFATTYLMDIQGTGTLGRMNRADDGVMQLFQSAGNTEGNIAISGSTCTYTTFTGAHWSQLADLSTPTILKGTVMESIAALCDWYVVEVTRKKATTEENEIIKVQHILQAGQSVGDTITTTIDGDEYSGVIVKETNTQLTKVKVSDTEDSKAVYGVHQVWAADAQDEGDMNVVGLGTFVVRVHKDETVAIGDLLSSKGDGTAKVQADDIMRSKTIAKVTSTIKQQTYDDDSYLVPCTLHCG